MEINLFTSNHVKRRRVCFLNLHKTCKVTALFPYIILLQVLVHWPFSLRASVQHYGFILEVILTVTHTWPKHVKSLEILPVFWKCFSHLDLFLYRPFSSNWLDRILFAETLIFMVLLRYSYCIHAIHAIYSTVLILLVCSNNFCELCTELCNC